MSFPTRVRVAVVGAVVGARTCHLPALRSRPEVDIVAISDADPQRAAAAAADFGIELVARDWQTAVSVGVDACVVATPAAVHYEHARAALNAGAHVLVEKPMTLRPEHAADLVSRAAAVGRQIVVSLGWNYSTVYQAACALFEDPGVGLVEHVLVHMASGTRGLLTGVSLSSTADAGVHAVSTTWTDPRLSGGGYGQAQLPHALGVALGVVGESVLSAEAVAGGLPGQVETCLAASGRLSGGGSIAISGASFPAGLSANRQQLEIRVFGSEGNLLIDFERDELCLDRPDGMRRPQLEPGAGRYDGRGPVNALVDIVLRRIATTPSPGELGLRTVEALGHVYDALATGLG